MEKAENDLEMLDLVDDQNRVIGSISRKEAHEHPERAHRAVHVVIRNVRGEVLLQKRSLAKRIQPGKWDTSVGGHVPQGESYEQGAFREMTEELGIVLEGASHLALSHAYIWRSAVETEHVQTYVLRHEGPFAFNKEEIDEVRFWSGAELKVAAGTGVLTPNLEEELRRIKLI